MGENRDQMDEQAVRERDARAYEAVYEAADFTELRRRYKNFVVPWVRRMVHAMQGSDHIGDDRFDPMPILLQSDLFALVETARFRHWQDLDRNGLRLLAQSHSRIAVLTESRREAVLDQVDALYYTTARPPEPLRMPYFTDCYRARPSDLANYTRTLDAPVAPRL